MTIQLQNHAHWHFIGIGGIGMSGLARLLLAQGAVVSGTDITGSATLSALQQQGAKIQIGHSPSFVPEGAAVVVSSSVGDDNPELIRARQLGNPIYHRSDLLAGQASAKRAWAVAGTHGKTTTSSLLASVLANANMDPSFAIGGVLKEFGTNAWHGDGDLFVMEADESDGTLVKYHPEAAIITNLDDDHLDFYGTMAKQEDAFRTFAANVEDSGRLLWFGDDLRLMRLGLPGISYGFGPDCSLRVSNPRQQGWMLRMDLVLRGVHYPDVEVALLGEHNALNAAAVFGLCLLGGVEEEQLRAGLANFKGVGRRCDHRGYAAGVTVIDDYAHHPAEISATLQALRLAEPQKRITALFQPHRYSRTAHCMGHFAPAFSAADKVVVTDIYAAGEDPLEGVHPKQICAELSEESVPCEYVPRRQLLSNVAEMVSPGDLVVTLGAGDISAVSKELLSCLSAKSEVSVG